MFCFDMNYSGSFCVVLSNWILLLMPARGMMYYRKALELQAFLDMAKDEGTFYLRKYFDRFILDKKHHLFFFLNYLCSKDFSLLLISLL